MQIFRLCNLKFPGISVSTMAITQAANGNIAACSSFDRRLKVHTFKHISTFLPIRTRLICTTNWEWFSNLADDSLKHAILGLKDSRCILNLAGDEDAHDHCDFKGTRKFQEYLIKLVLKNLDVLTNLTTIFVRMPIPFLSDHLITMSKTAVQQLCSDNASSLHTAGWVFCEDFGEIKAMHEYMYGKTERLFQQYRGVLKIALALPQLSTLYLPSMYALHTNPVSKLFGGYGYQFNGLAYGGLNGLWSMFEGKGKKGGKGTENQPLFRNLRQLHFHDSALMVQLGMLTYMYVADPFPTVELVTVESCMAVVGRDAEEELEDWKSYDELRTLFPNAVVKPRRLVIGLSFDSNDENNYYTEALETFYDEACAKFVASVCSKLDLDGRDSRLPSAVQLIVQICDGEETLKHMNELRQIYDRFCKKMLHGRRRVSLRMLLLQQTYIKPEWEACEKVVSLCRKMRIHRFNNDEDVQQWKVERPESIPKGLFEEWKTSGMVVDKTFLPSIKNYADAYYVDAVRQKFAKLRQL